MLLAMQVPEIPAGGRGFPLVKLNLPTTSDPPGQTQVTKVQNKEKPKTKKVLKMKNQLFFGMSTPVKLCKQTQINHLKRFEYSVLIALQTR